MVCRSSHFFDGKIANENPNEIQQTKTKFKKHRVGAVLILTAASQQAADGQQTADQRQQTGGKHPKDSQQTAHSGPMAPDDRHQVAVHWCVCLCKVHQEGRVSVRYAQIPPSILMAAFCCDQVCFKAAV